MLTVRLKECPVYGMSYRHHKNLWTFPLGSILSLPDDLRFEVTPQDDTVAPYYRRYPYRLVQLERFYMYLEEGEKKYIEFISFPRADLIDLLDEVSKIAAEPRDLIAQWLNRSY